MKRITLLTAVSLLLGTVAWAQITVNPTRQSEGPNAFYADVISEQEWDLDTLDPLTWDVPSFPAVDYGNAVFMDVFFIGREASFTNLLGMYWEDGAIGGPGEYNDSLFDNTVDPGYTIRFNLETAGTATDSNIKPSGFDFLLDSSDNTGLTGGVWSLFNSPDNNDPFAPEFDYSRGTVQMLDGINYYLYAFEDVWAGDPFHDTTGEPDYDDFIFGVVFRDRDGDPITPIPEPSTYGALGIAFLLGLIGYRKFRARNGKAA